MSDEIAVRGPDDILHDVRGAETASRRIDAFLGPPAAPAKAAGGSAVLRAARAAAPAAASTALPSRAGRRLLVRCPENTRKRYFTLLAVEEGFSSLEDYSVLISLACQILEAELERLVAGPARALADVLAAVLDEDKKARSRAEAVAQWGAGKLPTTIGVEVMVLLALRRGSARGVPQVGHFLQTHFTPRYAELLTGSNLVAGLNDLRDRFRNPACHGTQCFDAAGYERFVRLALGNRRVSAWDARGAEPGGAVGEAGVLHHHWSESRLHATAPPLEALPPPDPVEDLLALETPAASPLRLDLEVRHAASPALREIGVKRPARPFALGDAIRLSFQANLACHVVLLDVGTGGAVTVVRPNAWSADTRAAAGQTYFLPPPDGAEFDLALQGRPGRERVCAAATLAPLEVPLAPPAGAPFRVLTAAEVGQMAQALAGLDPATWAVAVREFEVKS